LVNEKNSQINQLSDNMSKAYIINTNKRNHPTCENEMINVKMRCLLFTMERGD